MPAERRNAPPLSELTAITTLDGRYRKHVGDLAWDCSEAALFRARVEMESEWLIAISQAGVTHRTLSEREVKFLHKLGPGLSMKRIRRIKEIEDKTRHDVKATEIVFGEIFAGTSLDDMTPWVHAPLTSSDNNNIADRLCISRGVNNTLLPAMRDVTDHVMDLADRYKGTPMIGRTHGQAAVPTTLGHEFAVFGARLDRDQKKIANTQLEGKVNGATGTLNAFTALKPDFDWLTFNADFVRKFGLKPNLLSTQINPYEDVIEYFQSIQRANGVLMDLDQDAWRYISDHYFVLKAVEGEAGSSTMAQKVNPIDFENSSGNIKWSNGGIDTFTRWLAISRLQRDLEDSTLLRNAGNIIGHSLLAHRNTLRGFGRLEYNTEGMESDLLRDWTILAEPIQLAMRASGDKKGYDKVVAATRGKILNEEQYRAILPDLIANLPEDVRAQVEALTPLTYTGEAEKITALGVQNYRTGRDVQELVV